MQMLENKLKYLVKTLALLSLVCSSLLTYMYLWHCVSGRRYKARLLQDRKHGWYDG